MTDIKISLIVACASNRAIGRGNAMLWHIAEDFRYFKRVTMGKPMVMGRKTFESLPGVLPGRVHIIVSRFKKGEQTDGLLRGSQYDHENVVVESDLNAALEKAREMAQGDEVFIVGGAQIYALALQHGLVDRMYITEVHRDYEADAFFPEYDAAAWCEVSREECEGDPSFAFTVLERRVPLLS